MIYGLLYSYSCDGSKKDKPIIDKRSGDINEAYIRSAEIHTRYQCGCNKNEVIEVEE